MTSKVNPEYDNLIELYAGQHLAGFDWRLLKAQLHCESGMNCEAVSSVGARGLGQFMPETWQEYCDAFNLKGARPTEVEHGIQAAAWYMGILLSKWTSRRPPMDRYALALASYNAGFGNILKAQRLAQGDNDYKDIIVQLVNVTGRANAKQTSDYVRRNLTVFNELVLLG